MPKVLQNYKTTATPEFAYNHGDNRATNLQKHDKTCLTW